MPDPATAVLTWLMSPGSGEQLPSLEDSSAGLCGWNWRPCAGMPIETFFPSCGTSVATARVVCSTCKVQPECLDYARADSDTMGLWGGTSERERRQFGVVA